ncbi:hypothetical protein [Methylocystis sp.]|uniref:hypothetical protein n=1 Tax=Methylocystis sp. TaxID=1911079 RepID=UPI003D1258BA
MAVGFFQLRAERRAGEPLKDLQKAVGNQHSKSASPQRGEKHTKGEQIASLGVSKKHAENWQKLASVPQEIFDGELKRSQNAGSPVNTRERQF